MGSRLRRETEKEVDFSRENKWGYPPELLGLIWESQYKVWKRNRPIKTLFILTVTPGNESADLTNKKVCQALCLWALEVIFVSYYSTTLKRLLAVFVVRLSSSGWTGSPFIHTTGFVAVLWLLWIIGGAASALSLKTVYWRLFLSIPPDARVFSALHLLNVEVKSAKARLNLPTGLFMYWSI